MDTFRPLDPKISLKILQSGKLHIFCVFHCLKVLSFQNGLNFTNKSLEIPMETLVMELISMSALPLIALVSLISCLQVFGLVWTFLRFCAIISRVSLG